MVRTATMPHSLPRTCPAGRTAASPDALRRKAAACAGPGATGPGATGPGRHGARVIRPWLRGFGPTRFLSAATVRSGQQAALGSDLIALLDALRLDTAILAGYDWGGLSSCVAAALFDESTFDQSAASFDNPDFVDVVIHAYRHSFGLAEGDPAYEELGAGSPGGPRSPCRR